MLILKKTDLMSLTVVFLNFFYLFTFLLNISFCLPFSSSLGPWSFSSIRFLKLNKDVFIKKILLFLLCCILFYKLRLLLDSSSMKGEKFIESYLLFNLTESKKYQIKVL
jgi:succinate dehydrogenase/fumarate reductase cytochrome b subunit